MSSGTGAKSAGVCADGWGHVSIAERKWAGLEPTAEVLDGLPGEGRRTAIVAELGSE